MQRAHYKLLVIQHGGASEKPGVIRLAYSTSGFKSSWVSLPGHYCIYQNALNLQGVYMCTSKLNKNLVVFSLLVSHRHGICVVTMTFKVLYKSILHCSVHRVTASILYIVLPLGSIIAI